MRTKNILFINLSQHLTNLFHTSPKDNNTIPKAPTKDTGFFNRSSNTLKAFKNLKASSFMNLSSDILKTLTSPSSQKSVIDTDLENQSQHGQMIPSMATLMLTPAIISKRLRQAIHAINDHRWEDITYLLHANPWLSEMTDVISGQLLLHHLSLHGSNAPNELNSHFPH